MKALPVSSLRLAVGLVQGMALYFLYMAMPNSVWPESQAMVLAPLTLIAFAIPTLVILNLNNMPWKSLINWMLVVGALLIMLGVYDVTRRAGGNDFEVSHQSVPSLILIFFIGAGLFIAQSLVSAAVAEGRYIASYTRYFDVAWKLAIQLIFSVCFVGIFWAVLMMGNALFLTINITFMSDLMKYGWFNIPITTLAFSYALHITDVRANLVRGIRTLKLMLLSWLLPIMTLFVSIFIASAPFKGLDILWSTHHTSQILLGTIACLILLINAAYHDGTPEHRPGKILRYSGSLGSVLLLPLVCIALYAVALRVCEYGWTINIIDVFSCLIVAFCYAIGYLWAAIVPNPWLRKLEKVNIYTSFVILIILLALFTPIADPARLSVADQVNRLKKGVVSADNFDYAYLKREGESYGLAALNQLKTNSAGAKKEAIKTKAAAALLDDSTKLWGQIQTSEGMTTDITVYPQGRVLPDSFVKKNWKIYYSKKWMLPACLFDRLSKCDAFIIDATHNTPQQIILMNSEPVASLFTETNGDWVFSGSVSSAVSLSCHDMREALHSGKYKMVPSTGQDLEVNGLRFKISPNVECP